MAPRDSDAALFQALLEATIDHIYVVDESLRYTHVSAGGGRAIGTTAEQMVGRSWRELGFPPAVMEPVEADWREVFATGQTRRRVVSWESPDGLRWAEYTAFPVRMERRISGVGVIARDITARVLAEEEVRRSRERYRGFVTNSSEGIWRFEVDEPIDISLPEEEQVDKMFAHAFLAECNEAMARMYGFDSPAEITGSRLPEMMPPHDPQNRAYLLAFLRSGYRLTDAESVETDRYGRPKYFLNSLTGVVEKGRLVRAWGTQRDVTPQKEAAERLRLSEERLRALVAASSPVIWTTSPEGKLQWISSAWQALTGQSPEQARDNGWLTMLHPEDQARTQENWRTAYSEGKLYRNVARVRMSGGGYRYFEMRAAPVLDADRTVREWVGSCTDIDAQQRETDKLAAEQMRTEFLAKANDLFMRTLDYEQTLRNLAQLAVPRLADWCVVDMIRPDGTLERLTANHPDPAMRALAVEMHAKHPPSKDDPFGPPRVVRTGRTEWANEISEKMLQSTSWSEEQLELLRSLDLRSFISTPIKARQQVVGVLTLIRTSSRPPYDEGDVRLAEELAVRAGYAVENARLYRQALEANRAKDEFLATLSHELRTPLTSILGWANLVQLSHYEADTMRKAVDTIERSARAQAALIDDLLDVSRIITGKFTINPVSMEVMPVIREVVAASRPAAEAKRIEIKVSGPDSLAVRADPQRFQQIIWNLVSNAVKFTPEGGGNVEIVVSSADSQARIEVRDRGMGIDQQALPRVFDRFWQADSSSHRQQGGLGLGLAIVRHLTEMHGGSVRAESAGIDRGATFTVTLPVAKGASVAAPLRPSAASSVLLVDDDQDSRAVVARTLRHFGAEVTPVPSAPDALRMLGERTFDLILTDLAMPGHDGYWLLEQVRRLYPSQRVAAITALGQAEEQVLRAGFETCVRKPVDPARLADLLLTRQ